MVNVACFIKFSFKFALVPGYYPLLAKYGSATKEAIIKVAHNSTGVPPQRRRVGRDVDDDDVTERDAPNRRRMGRNVLDNMTERDEIVELSCHL